MARVLILALLIFSTSLWSGRALLYAQSQTPPELYLSYEQRLVLSYLLLGAGESQEVKNSVYERMNRQLTKVFNQEVKTKEVQTFEEFLSLYRGEWPNSYSLESDLQLIEKSAVRPQCHIQSRDQVLNQRIEKFIEDQNQRLSEKYQNLNLDLNQELLMKMALPLLTSDEARRQAAMEAFSKTENLMAQEFEKIKTIADQVSIHSSAASTEKSSIQTFMSLVLTNYFGRVSIKTRKQIMSQFIGENLEADSHQRFEIMVMNAGPQFQKLLQIVAREAGFGPQMLTLFKKLESKVRPIPPALVRDLFESERLIYNWTSYDLKPLGVGTMAQVHVGQLRTQMGKRDVVIRFLKPEIETRVEEDKIILGELAPLIDSNPELRRSGFPRIEPLVEDLTKTVTDELNLKKTIEHQVQGRNFYQKEVQFKGLTYITDLHLSVPEVIVVDKKSVLMVQELVEGKKLDHVYEDWVEVIPDVKKLVIEELARTWLDELAFKSGFFHSDLHQGNFLVDITADRIKVNILDFGMGGYISKEMQKNFLLLASGVEILNAKMITESLWAMSSRSNNMISKNQLERAVQAKISELNFYDQNLSLDKWASWAINEGLRYPSEFIGVNRGIVILEKLLKDAGSSLTISQLGKRLALLHFRSTLKDLVSTGVVSVRDFAKLGMTVLDSNPQKLKKDATDIVRGLRCEVVFTVR
ncbi:MAG: hypothetical protein BroJett040_20670 [Oligoflexia bacterium]|nr:MAG: hypothetical protein BroJett040_20670 [Oligoflexia bacterium]